MAAPDPLTPGTTTADWGSSPFPPEVVAQIINRGLSQARVFDAFTRRTTSRASVAMLTASPDGFDWVAELGLIPLVDLHDTAVIAVPHKLAGLVALSNESVADASLNLTAEVGRLVGDAMGQKVDADTLYTATPANSAAPTGLYSALTKTTGTTLRDAVVKAAADIIAAGGVPDKLLVSGALWATEITRRETVAGGGSGLLGDLGIPLEVIVAPALKATDGLLIASAGCFGVVHAGPTIESTTEGAGAWEHDATVLRVKARVAAVIPAPAKSARALAVS